MKYDIDINGHIGAWGFSKTYIKYCLNGKADVPVAVRVNSLGGSLDDGLDIRQQFLDHGNISCYLFGFVASAATILAMGAKKICMSKHAFFLVHKVSNWVEAWGSMNADQIQEVIDKLDKNKRDNDKIDLVLAEMYADRTGKTAKEMLELMHKNTWLTAEEAKEYGFIDEILEDEENQFSAEQASAKFNMFGITAVLPSASPEESPKESFRSALAEEPKEHVSWLQNFLARFKKENNTNTPIIMNTDFTNVNELLSVDSLPTNDKGEIVLTAEQMQKINDKLLPSAPETKEDKTDTALEDRIAALENEINDLKSADGAEVIETVNVTDTHKTVDDMYNLVKDLI